MEIPESLATLTFKQIICHLELHQVFRRDKSFPNVVDRLLSRQSSPVEPLRRRSPPHRHLHRDGLGRAGLTMSTVGLKLLTVFLSRKRL
ncbi:MAG: hypothetical protein JWO91_1049 [Acidobacteriaceae bacterium]|nr:hypothetical protein [Acidobacteriaceae bacterium]